MLLYGAVIACCLQLQLASWNPSSSTAACQCQDCPADKNWRCSKDSQSRSSQPNLQASYIAKMKTKIFHLLLLKDTATVSKQHKTYCTAASFKPASQHSVNESSSFLSRSYSTGTLLILTVLSVCHSSIKLLPQKWWSWGIRLFFFVWNSIYFLTTKFN